MKNMLKPLELKPMSGQADSLLLGAGRFFLRVKI